MPFLPLPYHYPGSHKVREWGSSIAKTPNIRCFVAKLHLSRFTRFLRGNIPIQIYAVLLRKRAITTFLSRKRAITTFLSQKRAITTFLSQKRAITTFLSRKFMITLSSIAFEDFLGSSIAPQVMPPCWKPIHPQKVCDFPLAVVDARTFRAEDLVLNKLHVSLGFATTHLLGGLVHHDPRHEWAYFPFQSTSEVLVFHQYSKDKLFANPHSSFHNRNCPEATEERVSVEMRLALFF